MTPLDLSLFVAIAALGSFVQALSGFALGLIVLGCVSLLQLAPIGFTAAVISMISLVNGGWVLARHPRAIQWRSAAWALVGLIPAVGLGLALLAAMDSDMPGVLRQLLGVVILAAGMLLMLRPHPRSRTSGRLSTLLFGTLGGVLGGLFSTAGPPVVFHFYRQPWTISAIRSTLLAVFVLSTVARIIWQSARGELHWPMVETALYCTVPVLLAAQWGARIAPRIAPLHMRRLAFALLAVTGAGLLLPTTPRDDLATLTPHLQEVRNAGRSAATVSAADAAGRATAVGAAVSPAPAAPSH